MKKIAKWIYIKINRFFVYLYYKLKYRGKLLFPYSAYIVKGSTFEGANRLHSNSFFEGSLGYGTYLCENVKLRAYVGRFTSIAPGVECNNGAHPYMEPYVTTSPMFYSTSKPNGKTFATENMFNEARNKLVIGNDCWIGQNAFFAGGIVIGDGAVILAGAYVVENVPPYAIVGGVPARVIKYRYDNETIDLLLKVQWWNKPTKWLKENWRLLYDMNSFKEYFIDKTN